MPLRIKINITGESADKIIDKIGAIDQKQYRAVSEKLLISDNRIALAFAPIGGILYSKAYIYDGTIIISEVDGIENTGLEVSLPDGFNGKHALVSYLAENA